MSRKTGKHSKVKKKTSVRRKILMTAALITALLVVVIVLLMRGGYEPSMKPIGNEKAAEPEVTARAAVLYSPDLDEIVYAKNENTEMSPYSITKLMTAYLASQNLDMNTVVTVSGAAAAIGESTMYLQKGEEVTVEQLMYGTLLLSGNDAAYALGEATSGDMKSFVELMNATAKEWGCTNTHFANPNGMYSEEHYTTAKDFAIIANHTLSDPNVLKIASSTKYKMPVTNLNPAREMTDHLILKHDRNSGVIAGKTGYWSETDCSAALKYRKKDMNMILVVLGDTEPDREDDAEKLLAYSHKVTPGYIVDTKDNEVGKVWVKGGKNTRVSVYPRRDSYAYPKNGNTKLIETEIVPNEKICAPLSKGDVIGKYIVTVGGKKVATRNLVVREDVEKGAFTSQLYISNKVAGIMLGVIVLAAALYGLTRKTKKKRVTSADYGNR